MGLLVIVNLGEIFINFQKPTPVVNEDARAQSDRLYLRNIVCNGDPVSTRVARTTHHLPKFWGFSHSLLLTGPILPQRFHKDVDVRFIRVGILDTKKSGPGARPAPFV